MSAVGDALFQDQLHQLFGRRAHILKALSEGDDREAHTLKVLDHLHGSPAVEGDLTDVEPFAKPFDELFDISIMDHVALGGLQETLSFPHIVRDVIPVDPLVNVFFWYPEIRQDHVLVVLVQRRKDQHESGNICGRRKVQSTIADTAFEVIFVCSKSAAVPFFHRHPAHSLFDPLVEP